jgi:hypothetical protein
VGFSNARSVGFRPDSPRRTEFASQPLAIFTTITQLDSGPVVKRKHRQVVRFAQDFGAA